MAQTAEPRQTFAARRARLLEEIARIVDERVRETSGEAGGETARETGGEIIRENGRQAEAPRLIAVSKTWPAEVLAEAVEAGQKDFGENRLQELRDKFSLDGGSLTELLSAELRASLVVHFIGQLQSKKVREAVQLCDWIHTLDRPSLVEALAKEQHQGARLPKLLVQVNTGAEPQKGGVAPNDLDSFLKLCATQGLTIAGLMCLPPQDAAPAPHFAWLQQAAHRYGLKELSCGMSGDWQEAVALGTTCLRLGTALFGARQKSL